MLRVELACAKPGMKLAVPVTHPRHPTRVLLRGGFELDASSISRLIELNIRTVWVAYPSLASITQFINPQAMQTQAHLVEQISETFEKVQSRACAKLPYNEY